MPDEEPLEAENCGDGIELPRDADPDEPPETFEPEPEPYVGAGPIGAVLLGTATENGLLGT